MGGRACQIGAGGANSGQADVLLYNKPGLGRRGGNGMASISHSQSTASQEVWLTILRWFDSWAGLERMNTGGVPRVDWLRCIPIIAVHLMCFGVLWVGWSWTAVAVAVAFYFVRMFAITGWYHRY